MNPKSPSAGGVPPSRLFRVAYSTGCQEEETPRLHQTRDGDAALEFSVPLARHGVEFASTLHFYPNLQRPAECFSSLRPSDLLLMTTRPPIELWLNDGRITPSRRLIPAGNGLESAIFTALAPFFSVVSRFAIEVSHEASGWLTELGKEYADLEFTRYGHAFITHRGRAGDKHAFGKMVSPKLRQTVGYFIRVRQIPQFGCGLICSFAPGGVENLLFARLIRRHYSHWLAPEWSGFGFVRFKVPDAAEDTPLSAADFDSEIVGELLAEHVR